MPESVWDYPRPPRVERCSKHVTVTYAGVIVADTTRSLRVLETSHPPTFYIPREDIEHSALERSRAPMTFCEFKGYATYFDVVAGGRRGERAAWTYETPTSGFEVLAGAVAFYASAMDECRVGGEVVQAQPGDFYGGWVTSDVEGPFKGGPGTRGW